MSKTVIAIFSDPNGGSEEALGRMFNGLVLAGELQERGEPFEIIFQGTGTRWPEELAKKDHPAHALYIALLDHIGGVCGGCAEIFGAAESVGRTSLKLLQESPLPGPSGVTDMAKRIADGDRFLTF